jgi:hypothetical protein
MRCAITLKDWRILLGRRGEKRAFLASFDTAGAGWGLLVALNRTLSAISALGLPAMKQRY